MIITKEILNQKVPKEMMPTRLDSAMNLLTNIKYKDTKGLLLYNTAPDTWNLLYPFYELNHKFTIDEYHFKKEDMTYQELIDEYQRQYVELYENQAGNTKTKRINILADEYKKTFGIKDVNIKDELSPIYELKYSKSKNVRTLYYFQSFVANKVDNITDLFNQKIYDQKILPLNPTITEIDGVGITTNIPYLLSIKSNIDKLNNNLIDIK